MNGPHERFREWSTNFSEGLFLMLKVYWDESGTNDLTGQEPGSSTPSWCGFIHTPEYWLRFCLKWQDLLTEYDAPYFHFKEFADKNGRNGPNPYLKWEKEKRRDFLYDLATLASESAVPIGGGAGAKRMHELKIEGNPYERAITKFFEDFLIKLDRHWRNYTGRILFVLDKSDENAIWWNPVHKVHSAFSKLDARIGGLTFEDDKDPLHLPLQAADLLAYSIRQQIERVYKSQGIIPEPRVLDFILSKNTSLQTRQIPDSEWKYLVRLIREDEIRKKEQWEKDGNMTQKYFPMIHFPFENHGYKITTGNAV